MIPSAPRVQVYDCDGSSTSFAYPFRIQSAGQLRVDRVEADGTQRTLTLNTDYGVSSIGDPSGGNVTGIADEDGEPYTDGKIVIGLKIALTQATDYVENDAFPAQSHEDALDKLTLMAAQSRQDFERCIRSPLGQDGISLPPASQRASQLWACDADGNLTFVPTIKGDDITTIDASSVYFDHNEDAEPRLWLDTAGLNGVLNADVPNPGGIDHAVIAYQDDIPLIDSGQSRTWFSAVFRGQVEGTPVLTGKHSRFVKTIQAKSQISAPLNGDGDYIPQEVGCLNLVATAAAGTSRAKVEALVVSAREEAGLAFGSKGVAVQAITVRSTQGPDPDDRSQISDQEDSPETPSDITDATDGPGGGRIGSFTLRLNGGTVGGTLGGYRSWSAILATGRSGYLNGVVMGKRHTSGSYIDPESVGGWGGVWGGRSFWHDGTFAVRCTDAKPGWIAGGKDEPDYPCDIVSDSATAYAVDGTPVVGTRKTGWTTPTGTPLRTTFDASTVTTAELAQRFKALVDDLISHGLIGT